MTRARRSANPDEPWDKLAIRLQAEAHPLENVAVPRNIEEHCLHLMHLKAYQELAGVVRGKRVLDLGCNTGFGTILLAESARQVVGLDVSSKAIEAAQKREHAGNVEFHHFDGGRIPFLDDNFQVVVSFQVIEHVPAPGLFLAEIKRVLTPGCIAAFTTPNAAIRVDADVGPWNQFHLREFRPEELQSEVASHFTELRLRGLHAKDCVYNLEYRRYQVARVVARWRAGKSSPLRSVSDLRLAIIGLTLRVLPSRLEFAARRFHHLLWPRRLPSPAELAGITTGSFFYRDDELEKSLDLMVICKKSASAASLGEDP